MKGRRESREMVEKCILIYRRSSGFLGGGLGFCCWSVMGLSY